MYPTAKARLFPGGSAVRRTAECKIASISPVLGHTRTCDLHFSADIAAALGLHHSVN